MSVSLPGKVSAAEPFFQAAWPAMAIRSTCAVFRATVSVTSDPGSTFEVAAGWVEITWPSATALLCTVTALGFKPRPVSALLASSAARAVRLGTSTWTGGLGGGGGAAGLEPTGSGPAIDPGDPTTRSAPRGNPVAAASSRSDLM
jgi:hypothetical protein